MIYKMSSQDFNNILEDCKEKIEQTRKNINSIKDEINIKSIVSDYEMEYMYKLLKDNSYAEESDGYNVVSGAIGGDFNNYCMVSHAAFKREPINIFNLKAVNSKNDFFRDEVKISINEISEDYYKNILKSDNVVDKTIFFEERKDFLEVDLEEIEDKVRHLENKNDIKIDIELDEVTSIGVSKFNIIEIDPYLMGSFDIKSIVVYDDDKETPLKTIKTIKNAGKIRVILDEKYIFKKVTLNIAPKYSTIKNDIKIIPFGFKHIFFLEGDFKNDSHAVIEYKSESYIDNVTNNIILLTPFGKKEESLNKMGIKAYLDYKNNILENEHFVGETIRKPIARNVKSIFFKVPLSKTDEYETNSISAIKFFVDNR